MISKISFYSACVAVVFALVCVGVAHTSAHPIHGDFQQPDPYQIEFQEQKTNTTDWAAVGILVLNGAIVIAACVLSVYKWRTAMHKKFKALSKKLKHSSKKKKNE